MFDGVLEYSGWECLLLLLSVWNTLQDKSTHISKKNYITRLITLFTIISYYTIQDSFKVPIETIQIN